MENENRVRIQSDAIIKFTSFSIGVCIMLLKKKTEQEQGEVLNDEMCLNNKQ